MEEIDHFSAELSRSIESTKVDSIDRVDQLLTQINCFAGLDRFQAIFIKHQKVHSQLIHEQISSHW